MCTDSPVIFSYMYTVCIDQRSCCLLVCTSLVLTLQSVLSFNWFSVSASRLNQNRTNISWCWLGKIFWRTSQSTGNKKICKCDYNKALPCQQINPWDRRHCQHWGFWFYQGLAEYIKPQKYHWHLKNNPVNIGEKDIIWSSGKRQLGHDTRLQT